METVQVHSKSFVIRWVNCNPGSTVSFKVSPEKKSINFGVYQFDHSQRRIDSGSQDSDVAIEERLGASGGVVARNIERIKGGERHEDEFASEHAVIAFVFDNTFSKNTSKRVSFSFDVAEPTNPVPAPIAQPEKAPVEGSSGDLTLSSDRRYLSGVLLKHKRKKLQGYARRYFSLDTSRGLLNYYLDNRSRSLRGVMPVKICEIDVSTYPQIILDSGVEKWSLKALNEQEFNAWVGALQATREQQYSRMLSREPSLMAAEPEDRTEWGEIGAALTAAKNALATYMGSGESGEHGNTLAGHLKEAFQSIEAILSRQTDENALVRPLTRHMTPGTRTPGESTPMVSAPGTPPSEPTSATAAAATAAAPDSTLNEYASDSEDDVFYSAEDDQSDLSSEDSDTEDTTTSAASALSQPSSSEALAPLPLDPVKRRESVPICEHQPPSLFALLRKSKDISNTSVPVTSNEPISVLQKLAENFEYSELLDKAAQAGTGDERVLLVATFAVSAMAAFRLKDRAMRKPFNPMLGEVFELVREDKGFRFLAEKVSHRPPIFATHTESAAWTVTFTSRPYQKIWGKSAELTDTGIVLVHFVDDDETVEYSVPDYFLRNLVAGEKYIEPVGTTQVTSDKGPSATVEFKAGGMFSGRSEEVKIVAGSTTYEGKWTESISHKGSPVWTAGDLVPQPKQRYGWPVFTATLNEITEIEKDALSPVDSRLRPDQTAYEKQDVDEAERLKQALEQRQRERRKEYEESGKSHEPIFFHQGHNNTGNFLPKSGRYNYWTRRQNQDWDGIVPVLDA